MFLGFPTSTRNWPEGQGCRLTQFLYLDNLRSPRVSSVPPSKLHLDLVLQTRRGFFCKPHKLHQSSCARNRLSVAANSSLQAPTTPTHTKDGYTPFSKPFLLPTNGENRAIHWAGIPASLCPYAGCIRTRLQFVASAKSKEHLRPLMGECSTLKRSNERCIETALTHLK
jgi:hypothetical protein